MVKRAMVEAKQVYISVSLNILNLLFSHCNFYGDCLEIIGLCLKIKGRKGNYTCIGREKQFDQSSSLR